MKKRLGLDHLKKDFYRKFMLRSFSTLSDWLKILSSQSELLKTSENLRKLFFIGSRPAFAHSVVNLHFKHFKTTRRVGQTL